MKRISIPSANGYVFLSLDEIIYCSAEKSYTSIKTTTGAVIMASKNIGHIEKLINDNQFFRAHKSYLINLKYLSELNQSDGAQLVMSNDEIIPLARDRRKLFIKTVVNGGTL